jgi:protein-glucosylgalactosylhydroxylysine glucosidase
MLHMKSFVFVILFVAIGCNSLVAQSINRKALVTRHNVIVTTTDSLSSLTLGNGKFAFTVDATGLQTFPLEYQRGIPLGTQSEWAWHSFIDTVGYKREEALKTYHVNGRDITYMTQWNSPDRKKEVSNWFRQNPHRLQMGTFGFEIIKKDGSPATLKDIQSIRQELNLWTGEVKSHFTVEGEAIDVSTLCHGAEDAIGVKVKSKLLKEGRLKLKLLFPYPTGQWTDEGTNYSNDGNHTSQISSRTDHSALLEHRLDSTKYFVSLGSKTRIGIQEKRPHSFLIIPDKTTDSIEVAANFLATQKIPPNYLQIKESSVNAWSKYWNSGGAIDFSGSTDKRAFELERRIILSQYLMKAQEAGNAPPQETGLTYNSWFGKPHLEMTWWHAAHYALWGRTEYAEKLLNWYASVADKGREIAKRQGFDGVRWQKMTDNWGDETPSSIGAMLIWQQPHYIYFAEQCYRNYKDATTLKKYSDLVFATADFMASFAHYDNEKKRYILGKGLIPAQERFKAEDTYNPTYELVYWNWALDVAQQWKQRLKQPRNKKWDDIIQQISALPVQDNKYLFAENATDSYTNPEYRTDHPSVFAALGVMPSTGQVNKAIMKNTFDWIWNNWTWRDTWGWDFPMTAMTATRLGLPEKAIDALLMPIQTNTYLVSGHNFQDERLRIYMPGNGGLLTAIAMMVAGYDGAKKQMPGIPKNGQWKVRWEGLKKMP